MPSTFWVKLISIIEFYQENYQLNVEQRGSGMVVYTCDSSYLELETGGWLSEASLGKVSVRLFLRIKVGMVVYVCNSCCHRGSIWRIVIWGQPEQIWKH
jgi:hypothetical protein